jgi:NhaA family Na+:H+ antiporter
MMTGSAEYKKQVSRERFGGLLLIAAALAALGLANSPLAGAYETVIHFELLKEIAIFAFFFSVGIELRHEIRHGSLRNPQQAIVPVIAAIGGMVTPVLIFSFFNAGLPTEKGWGVPMSTDIAFALAIFAIAGRALPKALKTYVMTVAVADDSLTILMIAIFFASSFNVLTIVSLAGVVAGLFVPGAAKLSGWLTPAVSFGALPIFAFFSAGVKFENLSFSAGVTPLILGIVIAQLVGKPLGVIGTTYLVTKSKLGKLPSGITWADLRSVGWLFAMCFTVSMLMVELNFPKESASELNAVAVLSVFVATAFAGLISSILLSRRARKLTAK